MKRFVTTASFCAIIGPIAGASAGVLLGQVDDFEDGTTMNWTSGLPNPNPPSWVPGPGPTGFDDGFMVVTGNGQQGSGGQIVAFNQVQWAGNYLAAGVTAVDMQVQNFSQFPLMIGLRVEGAGGVFASTNLVEIPVLPFFTTITLPVTAASLTGGGNVLQTLSAVTRLRIQDPNGPIEGSIGIDNITAIPEPVCAWLLLAGLAALRRR